MRIPSLSLAAIIALAVSSPALQAVPITYSFVTTSAPAGVTLTATTSIDSSVTGVFSGVGTLLSFSATISGSGTATQNRTWTLGEVSFAQGTLKLLADAAAASRMAANARELMEQRFSWRFAASKFVELCQQTMDHQQRPS